MELFKEGEAGRASISKAAGRPLKESPSAFIMKPIMTEKSEDEILRDYLAKIGSKGGKKSRGGGRPRIPYSQMTPAQKARRARYLKLKKQNAAKNDPDQGRK
jgi:hypothetical protein